MAVETTPLRSLLRMPEVARTLASSLLGRLPYTAIELLLILRVRDLHGGFTEGGAVAGGFALGLGLVAPLVGRLVDLRGQRLVLIPTALACALTLTAIALAPDATPLAVLVGLAALAGMTHPPISGATRALWPDLVPPAQRHAIYSLESVGVEMTFMVGPVVLVGVVAAATSPAVGLATCAALLVAGTTAFATSPPSLRWRPSSAARTLAGALSNQAMLTLLAVVACMGASFGAIEVATTAHASEHGNAALVGPLLGTWALGSLLGGLASARGPAPADPARRLLALLAATALADALVAAAPNPPVLALALLLAGGCIAPAFATLYAMVADLATEGTLTESYTWLTTGIAGGMAVGSAGGGSLVDAVSTHAAFAGAVAMVTLAALVAAAGAPRLRLAKAGDQRSRPGAGED
jgi:MFS family permease